MAEHRSLSEILLTSPQLVADELARRLVPVVTGRTGLTTAGYPYLCEPCYALFRDTVPHILGMGGRALRATDLIEEAMSQATQMAEADRASVMRGIQVVRTCIRTAAITAPSDLWLLRFVLGAFKAVGLVDGLLAGEIIDPARCPIMWGGQEALAHRIEVEADLLFLLSRGYVRQHPGGAFSLADHPRAREVLEAAQVVGDGDRAPLARAWARVFLGESLADGAASTLAAHGRNVPERDDLRQDHFMADASEIELGFRLLPVILGLRASGRGAELTQGARLTPEMLSPGDPALGAGALAILQAAGLAKRQESQGDGGTWALTQLGERVITRGPGPFGIIEAYRPYMAQLESILAHGRSSAWVTRGDNIAASQDANRLTFKRANDALDRFCAETSFTYTVFIEHAIGRGEATRQRFERSGDSKISYVGADLEDASIDACIAAQRRGELPEGMVFIRHADIGKPHLLLDELNAKGLNPDGAVMIVGNGFHEVRGQSDAGMVEVFKGYHDAGIVLLFTEESALSIDDLLYTAWNTYHAGFKYVHDKSGQALRPADPSPPPRFGRPLPASWSACATQAGYHPVSEVSSRSRRIYPTRPADGHNPAISVNHFMVPGPIAERLGLG